MSYSHTIAKSGQSDTGRATRRFANGLALVVQGGNPEAGRPSHMEALSLAATTRKHCTVHKAAEVAQGEHGAMSALVREATSEVFEQKVLPQVSIPSN